MTSALMPRVAGIGIEADPRSATSRGVHPHARAWARPSASTPRTFTGPGGREAAHVVLVDTRNARLGSPDYL